MQRSVSQNQQYADNINHSIRQFDFNCAYYNRINFSRITSHEKQLMIANLMRDLRIVERNFQLFIDIK